ncbi:Heat shock 70 kDa protein 6, partial [Taenia solium]
MLAIVNQTLSDAKLDKADVHEILLVGGSTRVPKVQHLLQDAFSGSKFIKSINPDEAAACGATLLASDAIGEQSLMILEVAPLSLNLEMAGSAIKTLVERNMKIPTMKTEFFTTFLDNQPGMVLRMYKSGNAVT